MSSLVGALAAIPFGVLVDKTRRVNVLAVSIVLWGVAEAASGFSTSFEMLLLTRLLLGAVTATAVPAVASLTGDFFPAGERGTIYGYIVAGEVVGAGLGIGVSSLVSAALRLAGGVRPARRAEHRCSPGRCGRGCRSPRAAGRAGWSRGRRDSSRSRRRRGGAVPHAGEEAVRTDDAVLAEVRRRGVQHDEDPVVVADPATMSLWQVVLYVLRVRTNVYLIVASSLGYLFLAGIRTFAVLFARGHFDVGQAMATLMLGLVGAGSILGLLTAGRLADRWIERGRIDARIVVSGVAFIVAAVLFVPALLSTSLLVSLPLLFLALAALSAPNPPLDAAQLDVVPAQLWGRAQGVRTALRNTLEAFGPLLFGLIAGLFVPGGAHWRTARSRRSSRRRPIGLLVAFLIMLIPLGGGRRRAPGRAPALSGRRRVCRGVGAPGGAPARTMPLGQDA